MDAIRAFEPDDRTLAADVLLELRELTPRIRERLKRTTDDIVTVGRDLIRAKELLGHGLFGAWLEKEFSLSHRSATQFMRAADRFGGRLEAVSDLPSGVVLELASPSVPDDLVQDVLDGHTPATVGAVRDAVRMRRRGSSWRHAGRDLVQALWDLPDEAQEAAETIAVLVLDEIDSEGDTDFIGWVADVFERTTALITDSGEGAS